MIGRRESAKTFERTTFIGVEILENADAFAGCYTPTRAKHALVEPVSARALFAALPRGGERVHASRARVSTRERSISAPHVLRRRAEATRGGDARRRSPPSRRCAAGGNMRRRDAPRAFGAPNARRREDASNGARRIHRVVRVEEVLARVAPAPLESVSRSGRAGEKVLKVRRSPRERGRMGTSVAPLARRARPRPRDVRPRPRGSGPSRRGWARKTSVHGRGIAAHVRRARRRQGGVLG